MKNKLFALLTVCVMATTATFAEESLLPRAGAVGLEVNFAPFNPLPIQANQIKGRFFLESTMAARLNLMLGIDTDSNTIPDGSGNDTKTADRTTLFGFVPGIEIHVPVSNRVSPYFGAELGIVRQSTSDKLTRPNGDVLEVKNAMGTAYRTFLINAVMGVDLYLYKGLYMGAEMTLGLNRTTFPDQITENSAAANPDPVVNNAVTSNFGVNANPFIRLGWTF